jgi:hypothetical protein
MNRVRSFAAACTIATCTIMGCGSDSSDSKKTNTPAACTFSMSGSLSFRYCEIYQGDFGADTPAEFCKKLAYATNAVENVTCQSLGYTNACPGGVYSMPGYTCPT